MSTDLPELCPMCCAGPIAAGLGKAGRVCEGCKFWFKHQDVRHQLPPKTPGKSPGGDPR